MMSGLQLQTLILMLITQQQKVFCVEYWVKVSSKKQHERWKHNSSVTYNMQ